METEIIMHEIRRGKGAKPFKELLNLVDNGKAYIKGGIGLGNDILINITTKEDNVTYYTRFNLTWKEFNEKYGKEYLDNFNLSFC